MHFEQATPIDQTGKKSRDKRTKTYQIDVPTVRFFMRAGAFCDIDRDGDV